VGDNSSRTTNDFDLRPFNHHAGEAATAESPASAATLSFDRLPSPAWSHGLERSCPRRARSLAQAASLRSRDSVVALQPKTSGRSRHAIVVTNQKTPQ
jgi:hypothetical protein